MKKLTLGLLIVSTTTALAHNIEYKVCKGDTLSTIAKKFHVAGKAILHVNDLMPDHHMRPGHYLLIPHVAAGLAAKTANHKLASKRKVSTASTRIASHVSAAHAAGNSSYVVRNGDQDWALAMKNGTSVHKLHLANPGVDWDHLKIGLHIHLPAGHLTAATARPSHKNLVASSTHSTVHGVHMQAHWHQVEEGENDWIIAHKAGIRLPLLKSLNPQLDVSNLRVGQKVRVPGSSVKRLALRVPKIHSTHVAVNGDNVTIRTQPGLGAESICTVDQGTRAAVVDRDGNWYQLKFPKGTVGWVRGDLLKPLHVIEVAQVERRHHHEYVEIRHHAPSYIAESHHSRSHHVYVAAAHHHGSKVVEHMTSTTDTALDSDAGDAEGVLRKASSMRGTRYRWGAASRSSTDCSGFTMQVFASNGIRLPRISRDQAGMGSRVAYGDLKPGDLVFFHTMGRGHRISHVAIYKGNGRIIHASSGGGHVQENSIAEGYYRNRFVTARRVLKHHVKTVTKTEEPKKEVAETEKKAPADPKPAVTAVSATQGKSAF